MFMRIDKLLCELNMGSRSQVKELIRKGAVQVNGQVVKKPETKVDALADQIICAGKICRYQLFVYYMMNKPQGVITATQDASAKTVMDLFREQYGKRNRGDITGIPLKDMFPVGRLDKDTEGLLLITNNGALAHELLSPAKHVPKQYFVRLDGALSTKQAGQLECGVTIGSGEKTKPAIVEGVGSDQCYITITEGKFHQVKRMFQAVGLTVTYLKRMSMGSLLLDEHLAPGEIRELTENEVKELCSRE